MLPITYLIVAIAAVTIMTVACGQQHENRRLAKKRRNQVHPAIDNWPKVTVIIPLDGYEKLLRDNLSGWMLQDYHPREIVFVAAMNDDPAMLLARTIASENDFVPCRFITTPTRIRAIRRPQLMSLGLEAADPDSEIIVFASADSKPQAGALRWMAAGLASRANGIVTGSVWSIPRRQTLINRMYCSIVNALASCTGSGKANPVSTAVWGIRRELLNAIDLPAVWTELLDESWATRKAIRYQGLRIVYEPKCAVESTVETDFRQVINGLARRSVILRSSAPGIWSLLMTLLIVVHVAIFGSIYFIIAKALAGNFVDSAIAAAFLSSIYGLGICRSIIQNHTAKIKWPTWKQYRSTRRLDCQGWPVSSLLLLSVALGSLFVSSVRWRGRLWQATGRGTFRYEGIYPWDNILTPSQFHNSESRSESNGAIRRAA